VDGFVTAHPVTPDVSALRVRGGDLVREPDGLTVPLTGTIAEIAAALGIEAGPPPADVYPPAADLPPEQRLDLTGPAARAVLQALTDGDAALRHLTPAAEPILWPEHFDVGISVDEVNYGVSPGDEVHDLPYAYVGPWTPRRGTFWNEPFGAARTVADLGDVAAIRSFFDEGRERAANDPAA
jgi:hypothetical protein